LGSHYPLQGIPRLIRRLSTRPYLLKFPPPLYNAVLVTKLLTHWDFGDIPDLNKGVSTCLTPLGGHQTFGSFLTVTPQADHG
jgi:hypothetical protein